MRKTIIPAIVVAASCIMSGRAFAQSSVLAPDGSTISYTTNVDGDVVDATGTGVDGTVHNLTVRRSEAFRKNTDQRYTLSKAAYRENGHIFFTMSSSMSAEGNMFFKMVDDRAHEVSLELNFTQYKKTGRILVQFTKIKNGSICYDYGLWDQAHDPFPFKINPDNEFPGTIQRLGYFNPLANQMNYVARYRADLAFADAGFYQPTFAQTMALPNVFLDGKLSVHERAKAMKAWTWGLTTAGAAGLTGFMVVITGGTAGPLFPIVYTMCVGLGSAMIAQSICDQIDDWERSQTSGAPPVTGPTGANPDGSDPTDGKTPPPENTNTPGQSDSNGNDLQCGPGSNTGNVCGGDASQNSSTSSDNGAYQDSGTFGGDVGYGGSRSECDLLPESLRTGSIVLMDICL